MAYLVAKVHSLHRGSWFDHHLIAPDLNGSPIKYPSLIEWRIKKYDNNRSLETAVIIYIKESQTLIML